MTTPAPTVTTCAREIADGGFPVSDTTGYLGTLPPDGSFRAELTVEDMVAGGSSPQWAAANAGTTTWTFGDGQAALEATNVDGFHRCTAPMSSVGGEFVRLGATTGNCGITFDFMWRPEPTGISLLVVAPPADYGWTLKDFTDFRPSFELVWTRVE